MTIADWKIEALKCVFILYAFISAHAMYQNYFTPQCQVSRHYIAASAVENMTLRELSNLRIDI